MSTDVSEKPIESILKIGTGVSKKPVTAFWDGTSQSLVGWYAASEKSVTTFWDGTSQFLVDEYRRFGETY